MLRKIVALLILSVILLSCSPEDNIIYYSYNGATITRIDKDNDIFFYYGKFSPKDKLPKSFIKASYKGFDGGMGGFLIFNEDKTVEVRRMYDAFEQIGQSNKIVLNDTISHIAFGDWSDSIKGNYVNIVRISDVLNLEKKLNLENNSKVETIYARYAPLFN